MLLFRLLARSHSMVLWHRHTAKSAFNNIVSDHSRNPAAAQPQPGVHAETLLFLQMVMPVALLYDTTCSLSQVIRDFVFFVSLNITSHSFNLATEVSLAGVSLFVSSPARS